MQSLREHLQRCNRDKNNRSVRSRTDLLFLSPLSPDLVQCARDGSGGQRSAEGPQRGVNIAGGLLARRTLVQTPDTPCALSRALAHETEVLPAPLSVQWCKVTHCCEVVKVFEIDKPWERTLVTDVPHCFCIGDDRCLAWPSVNIAKPAAS
ncbi:unnamed protein product [Arctogadus glacialis]